MSNINEESINKFIEASGSNVRGLLDKNPLYIELLSVKEFLQSLVNISSVDKNQLPHNIIFDNIKQMIPDFKIPNTTKMKFFASKGTKDTALQRSFTMGLSALLATAMLTGTIITSEVQASQTPNSNPYTTSTTYNPNVISNDSGLSTDFYVDLNDPNLNSNSKDPLFLVNKVKDIIKYRFYFLSGGESLPEDLAIIQDTVSVAQDENGKSFHAERDLPGHLSKGHNVSQAHRYLIFNGNPYNEDGKYNTDNLIGEYWFDSKTNTVHIFSDTCVETATPQHVHLTNAISDVAKTGALETAFYYAYYDFDDTNQNNESNNQLIIYNGQVYLIPGLPGSEKGTNVQCR